jgi:(methylthio)acryloyl-CoA hydratase
MTADHGLLMESLMASVVETAPEAQARVQEFLEGRGPKVKAS